MGMKGMLRGVYKVRRTEIDREQILGIEVRNTEIIAFLEKWCRK